MENEDRQIKDNFHAAAYEITSRKKWAEKMLTGLRDIRKSRGANRSRVISLLEADILLSINYTKDEKLLNEKIWHANKMFLDQLSKKFPELSSNDLMLSAYLRSQVNNSVIAELRGIDVKSINMAKHRLKRKLGLNPEQDLSDFIRTY